MERALKIPEIVSMIVDHVAAFRDINHTRRRVDERAKPAISCLAKLARCGRIWWLPCIRALYHDVNNLRFHMLLRVIDFRWKSDKIPKRLPRSSAIWERFLEHTRHVRLMVVSISPVEVSSDPAWYCSALAFKRLAVLRERFTPTREIFPQLRNIRLVLSDNDAMKATRLLLQPQLRWITCTVMQGPVPGLPQFLEAVSEFAPDVQDITFQPYDAGADLNAVIEEAHKLRALREFSLAYPEHPLEFVRALSSLRGLQKTQLNLETPRAREDKEITLLFPSLRHLTLAGRTHALVDFLECASMPCLVDLILYIRPHNASEFDLLRDTISEKLCGLQMYLLIISAERLADEDPSDVFWTKPIRDFLPFGACPNLVRLEVRDYRVRRNIGPQIRLGLDDSTLEHISRSWTKLRMLVVENKRWAEQEQFQPARISFQAMVRFLYSCVDIRIATLAIETGTIPYAEFEPDDAPWAWLHLSRQSHEQESSTFAVTMDVDRLGIWEPAAKFLAFSLVCYYIRWRYSWSPLVL